MQHLATMRAPGLQAGSAQQLASRRLRPSVAHHHHVCPSPTHPAQDCTISTWRLEPTAARISCNPCSSAQTSGVVKTIDSCPPLTAHPSMPANTSPCSRLQPHVLPRRPAMPGHQRRYRTVTQVHADNETLMNSASRDDLESSSACSQTAQPPSSHAGISNSTASCSHADINTAAPEPVVGVSRRGTLLGSVATLAGLQMDTPAAHALKTITLRDGTSVEVFEHGMSLSIVSLRGSIPQEWILEFKSTLGKYAGFTLGQRAQLADIYKELSDPVGTKNSACMADVVTVGDAWLGPGIKAGLLQPIPNADNSRWFKWLSPRWRALLRRDSSGRPDPKGDIYAAPYRWGATLIAYRKDRLLAAGGHPINDWSDLLQPQLTNRVAMTDSSREFLGAALKAATTPTTSTAATADGAVGGKGDRSTAAQLGFNTCAQGLKSRGIGAEELADAAGALRKQVRLFSSRDHVRAFAAGDAWAIVGWSQDLITLAERSNMVELIVPASGTALFADLWGIPAHAQGGHMQTGPSPLLPSWLEFSLMPARSSAQSSLKSGAAPLLLDYSNSLPPAPPRNPSSSSDPGSNEGLVLSHESGYMPRDRQCLNRSEFLLPLDKDTLALYSEALGLLQYKK